MVDVPLTMLVCGGLVLASIAASKFSERLGFPALVMFLVVGMLAGEDGPGGIDFENNDLANAIGTIALAYILFSGGLDTSWRSVRPVLTNGLVLATVGVFLTALLLGVFLWQILGYSFLHSMLLASIVSSTDAAAVFAIMRSRGVSLKGFLRPLLELESGSNDPMAIFLTTGLLQIATATTGEDGSWVRMLPMFIMQMTLGLALGLGLGKAAAFMLNRARLDYEGLYPVLSLSIVLLVFGITDQVGGNGFLAVYLCGIVLGNSDILYKRSLMRFHDGIAWLMQIGLFVVLGLLVTPSDLPAVIGEGLLMSIILMFIARPVAVYLCMLPSRFNWRERTLVAWAGLRGSVPIVLATFPLHVGYPGAEKIFHLIFFVVLTSVLLQGKSLMMVARWLGVDKPIKSQPRYPLEFDKTEAMHGETREFHIDPDSPSVGKRIQDLGLPSDVLILLIRRRDGFVVPRGQTVIEPEDTLLVLAEPELLQDARRILQVRE